MNPAPNPNKNVIYGAPPGMEGVVGSLEVLDTGLYKVMCFEPTEDEIERIVQGEKVWVCMMSEGLCPMALGVGRNQPFEFIK